MLFRSEKIGLSKMLFVIDEVKYREDIIFVAGKTSAGTVKGIWKYSEAPAVGRGYHIELQINYPVDAEVSYKNKKKAAPSVCVDNDTVIFKGICEDMDGDKASFTSPGGSFRQVYRALFRQEPSTRAFNVKYRMPF